VIERTYEPAFPQHPERCWADQQGMSLRDYFAAKAMQGLITACETHKLGVMYSLNVLTANAYSLADAMLEARK
jgi:hypothetical protein